MHNSLTARATHLLVLLFVGMLYRIARIARSFTGYRHDGSSLGAEVLLTGTFNSEEWIMAFVRPMTLSSSCRNVVLATTFPVAPMEGLTVVKPPALLCRLLGDTGARLVVFVWQAVRRRPSLVGGFHISINALVADLAASLAGARSMYVCVGGPIEVVDGGLWGESRFFSKLRRADQRVEDSLLRTVRQFDVVATMGNKAATYFRSKGVDASRIHRLTGGVDAGRFKAPSGDRDTDIVFVGRLVPIKSLDLLLRVVAEIASRGVAARTRIVGRGPMEASLKELARDLGIDAHVDFAGFVPDIVDELVKAKCFVLTSESEGLSLAMIEAMLAGAIPVVADVGDLGDLVEHGVNGFLVPSRDPKDFADYLFKLINDKAMLSDLSTAAHDRALGCDLMRVANNWDTLFSTLGHR
jgi:glycosyltransferase involved in cell wall biosynthesis